MRRQQRSPASDPFTMSSNIFDEVRFMRLGNWHRSDRHTSLLGGAAFDGHIFRRFTLQSSRSVILDFLCRGIMIGRNTAEAFEQILSTPHVLDADELKLIAEVLREQNSAGTDIEHAEVGEVNGRLILAVRWTAKDGKFKLISLYFVSHFNLRVVREIHFSAPVEVFSTCQSALSEVIRSIQWRFEVPPVCVA